MKNILSLTAALLLSITFLSCDSGDTSITMKERIILLESAINTHDYEAYMNCFDSSCNYADTYLSTEFDTDYPEDTTIYSFGSLTISGNTVSCSSTMNGIYHTNSFTMINTGGDYYILEWVEDGGTIIFQK